MKHNLKMDVTDIRRENMRYLVWLAKGPTALADKLDRTQSQISQLSTTKVMGRNLARDIEGVLGYKRGWMDEAHPDLWAKTKEVNRAEKSTDSEPLLEGLSDNEVVLLLELIGYAQDELAEAGIEISPSLEGKLVVEARNTVKSMDIRDPIGKKSIMHAIINAFLLKPI